MLVMRFVKVVDEAEHSYDLRRLRVLRRYVVALEKIPRQMSAEVKNETGRKRRKCSELYRIYLTAKVCCGTLAVAVGE